MRAEDCGWARSDLSFNRPAAKQGPARLHLSRNVALIPSQRVRQKNPFISRTRPNASHVDRTSPAAATRKTGWRGGVAASRIHPPVAGQKDPANCSAAEWSKIAKIGTQAGGIMCLRRIGDTSGVTAADVLEDFRGCEAVCQIGRLATALHPLTRMNDDRDKNLPTSARGPQRPPNRRQLFRRLQRGTMTVGRNDEFAAIQPYLFRTSRAAVPATAPQPGAGSTQAGPGTDRMDKHLGTVRGGRKWFGLAVLTGQGTGLRIAVASSV